MKFYGLITAASLSLLLAACGGDESAEPANTSEPVNGAETTPDAEMAASEAAPVSLEAAASGSWRSEANKARDAYRNPVETLEFFGIEPDDTVVEVWPGGGWYTEILAPYLKDNGTYYAAMVDPSSPFGQRAMESFEANFISKPETYGDIQTVILGRDSEPMFAQGEADVVLTFRNVHNWMAGSYADKMFDDMYDALKPNGILGVVEHRLNSADTQAPGAPTGYVHEDYVKQLAEDAGFVFVDSSEVNANSADTKDHPGGVWTLPPTMRSQDADGNTFENYDPATYEAIGESDRMTLKFRKPTAEEIAEMEAAAAAEDDSEEE
tara:strand:+ start:105 stop:1073 length:969 start_codon:yes stop_codon:yes gene_type:complete